MIIKCVPWFALKSMNLSSIIVYWGFIKFAIKMTPNSTSKFKFSTNLWFILSLFSYRFSKSLNIMKFPYYCYHCYISSVNWFTNEPKIVTKCFKELIKFNICLDVRDEVRSYQGEPMYLSILSPHYNQSWFNAWGWSRVFPVITSCTWGQAV